MSGLKDNLEMYKRLLKMLAVQYGSKSEIVLHDLTNSYDSTIIEIENNQITNRKIGDCGSNLGLEILRQGYKSNKHDTYGYLTYLKDGRILRSSSMYIYNDNGEIEGCLCINTDITEMRELGAYFDELLEVENSGNPPIEEVFVQNVGELVDFYIDKYSQQVQKDPHIMDKQEKIKAVKYFDEKGVFLISKASNKICRYLKISKATLYSYLETTREETI